MQFFERYLEHCRIRYPRTAASLDLRARLSPNLFYPEVVELPSAIRDQAIAITRAFQNLRELPDRKLALENLDPTIPDPGNYSVLMSYDYHVDEQGRLRLIEINTNASMSLITEMIYEVQGEKNPFVANLSTDMIDCFVKEGELAGHTPQHVVICDENPQQQKMFAEFLMYQELFENRGMTVSIKDPSELTHAHGALMDGGKKVDLVYNRDTDFYLEHARTKPLHETMLARSACMTPHPHEYRLLADKDRLKELSLPNAIDALNLSAGDRATLKAAVIPTVDVETVADKDALWADRKRWFFKPKRSFGSKAAYRGSTMSRGTFQHVASGPYVGQEFVPPGTINDFKYDLRFFAYRDRIQLACARLYKGQTTNSQTEGGGIAAIRWV
jgi:hypothetical protein